MSVHFNIQINIQEVRKDPAVPQAYARRGEQAVEPKREIRDVLSLAVTADTEAEAYAKAHRLLQANQPPEKSMTRDVLTVADGPQVRPN